MPLIPHDGVLDSSLALIGDPYRFIGERCARLGTDLFRTRLLLRTNVCLMGRDAAALFYDEERFRRKGAVLRRFEVTLLGRGGVQGLDGTAHRHRKQLFTSLTMPDEAVRLAQISARHWSACAGDWTARDSVVLYEEARDVLCRSVCEWAGVPLEEAEVGPLARELAAMYEHADSLGPRHLWARLVRRKRDRWAAQLIEKVRAGRLKPLEESVLHAVAWHRDLGGRLLAPRVAGVELLNLLRPTVAVSVFITFAALALQEHPDCRQGLTSGGNEHAEMFAQEVRRFYPFFPAVAALVRRDFEWQGYEFRRGTRVLLGLYATNHDARLWESPEEFRPERFRDLEVDPFTLIPQGGGDRELNHRCPGDRISVELVKAAVSFLCGRLQYDVPEQDLRLEFSNLPALPRSRFVIRNVRIRA
ncbi:MAG: cytochrome P450 [Pirellulales bacterium]